LDKGATAQKTPQEAQETRVIWFDAEAQSSFQACEQTSALLRFSSGGAPEIHKPAPVDGDELHLAGLDRHGAKRSGRSPSTD